MLRIINSLSRKQKSFVFLSMDLLLIPLALLFAYALQSMPETAFQSLIRAAPILPFLLVICASLSLVSGLPRIVLNDYEGSAIALTAALSVALAVSEAGLSWLNGNSSPAGTHVMFGIGYFLFSVATRIFLYQLVSALYRRADPARPVLIYGAGTTGTQLAKALKAHEQIDPVAFVDDNAALHGIRLSGLPVYPPTRLAELVSKHGIRRVLLAMPSLSAPKQAQVARRLQKMGLDVQALPSFAQLIGEEALIDKLAPVTPNAFLGRDQRDFPLGDCAEAYTGRSIMVTGAGGSIGSEICRQLLQCRPARLVLFELSELALYTIDQEMRQFLETEEQCIDIVPVLGSVTDARHLRRVLTQYDVQVVLHAAAYKHVPLVEANPIPGLQNNVIGTYTLAQEAFQAGVERFLLISSDKAVRPSNVMGASKRMAELIVQDLATRSTKTVFSMVRFGNVLGSSGSVVPLFLDQISRGGPVTVTDSDVCRYFMTTREAVTLVLKAGSTAKGGEVFVLDMGEPVSILGLARQVIEGAGYTVRDDQNPDGDIEIEIIGLRPGEKIKEELTLTEGLTRTRFQKINCAREASLSELEIAGALRDLRNAIQNFDAEAARKVLEARVEGFADSRSDRKSS